MPGLPVLPSQHAQDEVKLEIEIQAAYRKTVRSQALKPFSAISQSMASQWVSVGSKRYERNSAYKAICIVPPIKLSSTERLWVIPWEQESSKNLSEHRY
jgi:hypothetical protein